MLKNIFSIFKNINKKEEKKVEVLKKRKSTEIKPKQFDSSETILKKEKIPDFHSILSDEQVGLIIPQELKMDYIIVSKSVDSSDIYILSSTEMRTKKNVDNELRTIKQKCSSLKYSIKHIYAPRSIIQIMYEEYNSVRQDLKKKNDGYISDFDTIMKEAMEQTVSDVHFEIRKKEARVRFRKHGEMKNHKDWSVNYGRDLSSVVYQVIAQEKDTSFIETQQQSARIERTINGVDLNIRLNTLPVSGGFDMVMRLLKEDEEGEIDTKAADLGYNEEQLEALEQALARPTGVIILAGTTGSGKSTTISTILNETMRDNTGEDGAKIKLITVEDPTEYSILHSSQSGVVRKKGSKENPFTESIRAAMRCDPDLLMVGEVRDQHTAELLVGAVQSGHTAFTTVHAASAVGIIPRLKGFNVGLDVLGSPDFISALIYQTLVRVTCKHCSISYDNFLRTKVEESDIKTRRLIKRLNKAIGNQSKENIVFRNKKGCNHCTNGITGRSVIAEIILPTPMILSAFERGKINLAKYYHIKSGGKLILDHGIEKIVNGIADPFDVEDSIGPLTDRVNMEELAESLGLTYNKNEKIEDNKKSEELDEFAQEDEILASMFAKNSSSLEGISNNDDSTIKKEKNIDNLINIDVEND